MTKEESKFNLTGTEFLRRKFIPQTEVKEEIAKEREKKDDPERSDDIINSLKRRTWKTVRDIGGQISLTDILNIGEGTRRKLGEAGFWSPSDVYKAWKEGNVDEIMLGFKGVVNKKETIANTILSAPEASSRLTKQEIIDKLPDKPKGKPFIERRKDEIKAYLKKLKVDGSVPVKITVQDEGERFTQEKAEAIIEPTKRASPVPIILTESKIIAGISAQKKKAKDKIFERGLRDSMVGVKRDKIKNLTAFKKFFDVLKSRNPKFQDQNKKTEQGRKDAKKAFKDAKNNFIKGTINAFKKDDIFINDPDTGVLRASDEEIAAKILSEGKSKAFIGQTNNFKIPSLVDPKNKEKQITRFLTAKEIDTAKPGELIFQTSRSGSTIPIRLTGYMNIEKPKDVDNLVEVLGANPKNGFIPIGHEHSDDGVKSIMNTFSVIVMYPPIESINIPKVKDVKKLRDRYVIKLDDDVFGKANAHLWVKKEDVADDVIDLIRTNKLDEIARDNFGKRYDELTEQEKTSLAINPDILPEIWGVENEYGGTVCEFESKGKVYRRLEALKKDIKNLSSIEKSRMSELEKDILKVVKDNSEEIATEIDKKLLKILDKGEKSVGNINTSPVPNCLMVPKIKKNKITIKTGNGSTYIEAKLDKVIDRCKDLAGNQKERCFVENLTVTQNFSDVVEPMVRTAIRKSMTEGQKASRKEKIEILSSIERKIRTGQFKEKFVDGRLEEVTPTRAEKREALNEAKLLGKVPLDTSKWRFLGEF